MKMVEFTVKGKKVLVNMDLVCEVHQETGGGCSMFFNTMATNEDQAYIKVDQNLDQVKTALDKWDCI